MEVNIEVYKVLAKQLGLPLQFVVKEHFVFDVLQQITALEALAKKLVFKGGTALNKVYFKEKRIQRFSEDLDFDYEGGLAQTREFCQELSKKLMGYKISEMRRVKETIFFECGYENPIGGKDHVRVDVASKKIITEKPLQIMPVSSLLTNQSATGLQIYSLEDLTARKLCALRQRTEGKDFYDVYHALQICGNMRGAVEKMLEAEGIDETPKEFLRKTAQKTLKADAKKLRNFTNPCIPTSSRPNWEELKNGLAAKLDMLAGA